MDLGNNCGTKYNAVMEHEGPPVGIVNVTIWNQVTMT